MIGNETLASVRAKLAKAIAATDGSRPSPSGRSEVAEALERFLKGPINKRTKATKSGRAKNRRQTEPVTASGQ